MERNSPTALASAAAAGMRSTFPIKNMNSNVQASRPNRPRLPSRKNRYSQIHARPVIIQMYSRLLIKKKQANSVLHTIAQSHTRRGGKRRFGTDGMLGIVLRHDANCGSMKRGEITLTFAFCSPIVRGGRGNGKRVARRLHCRLGSHEPAAAR